jgi:hypothetical protein
MGLESQQAKIEYFFVENEMVTKIIDKQSQ